MKISFNEENTKTETKRDLLPDGEYLFVVKHAETATSKAGNEMIKLTLEEQNSGNYIYDYLVPAKALWHVHDVLFALGLPCTGDVEFGPEDLIGKAFKADVITKEEAGYKPKNIIKTYKPAAMPSDDEAVPF